MSTAYTWDSVVTVPRRQRGLSAEELKAQVSPACFFRAEGLQWSGSSDTGWKTCRCPFHQERRPSFRIDLDDGAFACLACNVKGGDIISFTMQRYGIDFKSAIEAIAEAHGVRHE